MEGEPRNRPCRGICAREHGWRFPGLVGICLLAVVRTGAASSGFGTLPTARLQTAAHVERRLLRLRGGSAVEHQVQLETQRMMNNAFSVEVEDLTDTEMLKLIASNANLKDKNKSPEHPLPGLSPQMSWCSRSADVSNEDIQRDVDDQKLKQQSEDNEREKAHQEQSPPSFTCFVCSEDLAGKEWFMSGNSKHCSIRCAEQTAHRYIDFLAEQQEVLEGDEPRHLFATLL